MSSMTMLQPTPVVPSNAPPQQDIASSSRVLQEHSGNRQHHDYSYQITDQKYSSTCLSENAFGGYPVSQPAHIYQQTALQRNTYRHAYARQQPGHRPAEQVRKEARYLFHRFRSSDGYMKYRSRKGKDDKGTQEQKWPDRLEFAFFSALVNWPPMGRRKLPHKNKPRGRNELIADYIEEHTGEMRTRKQVSSHIQVLKPFVENDPHIMRYLSKDDLGANGYRLATASHGAYISAGRRMSHHPVGAPPLDTRAATAVMHIGAHDISKVKGLLAIFQPTDFQMFVQRKYEGATPEKLHTYTASSDHPRLLDQHVLDMESFAADYPILASMHASRPLECNVLSAEASIAGPTQSFTDSKQIELGISYLCTSRHLPAHPVLYCQNNFYRGGRLLREYSSCDRVPMENPNAHGDVETQVKFGSAFWAYQLAFLASRLRETTDSKRDPVEDAKNHLKSITAIQEVVMRSPKNSRERILVVHWKFRLATGPEGKACWARLRLPPVLEAAVQPYGTSSAESRTERVDSVYDAAMQSYAGEGQGCYTTSQPATLQSPFAYDNGSSTAESALNSATFQTSSGGSFDAGDGVNSAPPSAIDQSFGDNGFDFTGGNISISYDQMDFNNFDASAFDFDTEMNMNFATDPALQDFSATSQNDFSQQSYDTQWFDSYAGSQQQVHQASMSAGQAEEAIPDGSEQYDFSLPVACEVETQPQAPPFEQYGEAYEEHYSRTYGIEGHEDQAFGGAGQEAVVVKEEHELIALADSQFMTQQSRAGSQSYEDGQGHYHA